MFHGDTAMRSNTSVERASAGAHPAIAGAYGIKHTKDETLRLAVKG
jgi:hypothetical protein